MASLLLAAGGKGKRNALPHARVMIHQPLGGLQGKATDIEIHAQHTGRALEKIKHDTERDNFMSAAEARDYGLIDEVLTSGKTPR